MSYSKALNNPFFPGFLNNGLDQSDAASSQTDLNNTNLNPNAREFVPSYRKVSLNETGIHQAGGDNNNCQQAGSAYLPQKDAVGFTNRDKLICGVQKQMMQFLSHLGEQGELLEGITISLLPDGQRINVQFKATDKINANLADAQLYEEAALHLDMSSTDHLQHGLMIFAQFLQGMNKTINQKMKPKREPLFIPTITNNVTEEEIENQIQDINTFHNCFTFMDADSYNLAMRQAAFQKLCQSLGLEDPEQLPVFENYTLPSADDDDTDVEAYAADDELQITPDENSPEDCTTDEAVSKSNLKISEPLSIKTLHKNEEQLKANRLKYDNDTERYNCPEVPNCTPIVSNTATNVPITRGKTFGGTSSKPKQVAHQKNKMAYGRTKTADDAFNVPGVSKKTIQRIPIPSEVVNKCQGNISRKIIERQLPTVAKTNAADGSNSIRKPSKNKTNCNQSKKIVPRSNTTSLLRQTEVQKRLNLFRGSKPSDLRYGEYLFK